MCGITGAVWTDPAQAIDAATLERMTNCLRHRGPDDAGVYTNDLRIRPPYEPTPGVALGFRRLAILDLAGSRQPLANEDETVWLVFNGEVYNYRSLRRRLEGAGHRFRTDGDAEVILHLYEDLGPECFAHLDGMCAAAIWDARERRLVLGRDRLGKKPLVYRAEPGRVAFASELKSLLQIPGASRELDPGAIDEYLTYQYIPHPNTIFRGIRKLPPGHYAVFQDGRSEVQPYWSPAWKVEQPLAAQEAAARVRELFDAAVLARLQSDVPLGAFLSGGVDSSLVAASMQRQASTPIKTFSIGFPQLEFDESEYARRVAKHLGTEHHELQVTPDAKELLPKLVWHFDEPFADSSALPMYYLAKLAREHVTVALSGDGGDELFAGYSRYRAVALGALLDRAGPLRAVLGSRLWQRLPSSARQQSWSRRFKRFSAALTQSPARRYFDWMSIFNEERRAELYREEFVNELPASDPFEFLGRAWKTSGPRDALSCAANADLQTYLPCDLLTKVDITTMAHGLECRQPFLDHHLVEYAISLPQRLKFRGGAGKRILRAAFGDRIPAEIWRRPKMGFGAPLAPWFRHELRDLVRDALLSDSTRVAVYFRPEAMRKLVEEHQTGFFDHSARLWALLVLELWLKEWA